MSASTAFFGGEILTLDPALPQAEAVLVDDGTIVHVGSERDVRAQFDDATQEVDLQGNVLVPGFIDAHSHPLWAAKTRGAPVVDVR